MTLAPLEEHELSHIRIDELKFDQSNPNELTAEQMEALRKSMKKFGYLTPIIVDQNNMIADGEHRALIYKEFGFAEIPCFKVTLKDDIERRMLRQVMNKLHGEHDKQRDANELLQIFESKKLDELAELIAQPKEGLESILTKYHGIEFQHEDNFNPETLEELVPQTKLGDIWQLGQHRIICADCSDQQSVNKLMQGKKADMVFTDPPYGVDYANKGEYLASIGKANQNETPIENDKIEDYYEFYKGFLTTLVLNETNSIYITIAGKQLLSLLKALEDCEYYFSQLLVWVKNNHVLGRTDYANRHELIVYCWKGKHEFYGNFDTTVWEIDKPLSSGLHPVMKPIELVTRAIRNSSKPESLIFDSFLGSGSTLIACEQTNRICYGVEIDPHYCDVIVKRWEQYTGKKAEKCK